MAGIASARGRTSRALARPVDPLILAVAASTIVFGAGIGYLIAPAAWAVDAERNLAAGAALAAGHFGTDRGYLYSPLAAALTVPATWLPAGVAIGGWLIVKVVVLVVAAWHEARIRSRAEVALAAATAALFLPSVHDLLLGNVSILVAAAVALVVWRSDSPWTGLALGLVLATVPKPQLIPIFAWMLAFRPRAVAGAVVAGAVATGLGLVFLGPEPYRAWLEILRAPEYLDGRTTYGNLSLLAWAPAVALPLVLVAIAATAAAFRRGPWPALVATMGLGLLVAPYTMAYAAVVLLVVARPMATVTPGRTAGLALLAPVGIIVAFPVWVAGVMASALAVPVERWRQVPFAPGPWHPAATRKVPA